MADLQELTNSQPTTEDNDQNSKLDFRKQSYIDFMALNGLVFDKDATETRPDGTVIGTPLKKMSHDQLAQALGVSRQTLYDWRDIIPDFWGLVNKRRRELAPQSRLAKMHEVWFLSGLKPGAEGFRDRQMWLANFDDQFRMPTQKLEHEVSDNMAALMRELQLKKESAQPKVIDAQIISHETNQPNNP